jgi:hypothetical protein
MNNHKRQPPRVRQAPRRQRGFPGGRNFYSAGFIPELERAIERDMIRFNATRSFVIASGMGYIYNIDEQEHFDKLDIKRKALERGKVVEIRKRA